MGVSEHTYDSSATAAPDNWGTPDEVLEPIYQHFGEIGLDPCAEPTLPRRVKARGYIHDPEDGVEASWLDQGLVFVNPPYSDCARWTWKAARDGDEVIVLLPVRTSAKWWRRSVWPADVILFYGKRLKFVGAKYTAPFHSALIYWGSRPELFLTAFPDHEAFVRVDDETYRRRTCTRSPA